VPSFRNGAAGSIENPRNGSNRTIAIAVSLLLSSS
jgi:hypothetical protein